MKLNSTAVIASIVVTLGLTLIPAPVAAHQDAAPEAPALFQQSQSYTPPASFAPAAAAPAPFVRGTFTAAVIPRVSYPVADTTISSGFGPRTCSSGPCSTFHQGVDYPGAPGTPIKSIAAGTVTFVGADGNFGNKVTVEHIIDGVPHTTVYAHMLDGSFAVSRGQVIERGQLIGGIGNTGRSYGNHLHFEVHVAGRPVNPAEWLPSHDALPFP